MLNKNDFYNKNELLNHKRKNKIWENINFSLKSEENTSSRNFDIYSFSLGIAATVILFFTAIGIYTTIANFYNNSKPEVIRLNNHYSKSISKFENMLSPALFEEYSPIDVDNKISVKVENLHNLNRAIYELKTETKLDDYSTIKQNKLFQLYKMKLEILEKLIFLENEEI